MIGTTVPFAATTTNASLSSGSVAMPSGVPVPPLIEKGGVIRLPFVVSIMVTA
jgi:hypothetical protein